MGPNRYQAWWYSEVLGWKCDAYPTAQQAHRRMEEVEERQYFSRGLVIDMQEHLTGQAGYPTHQEFERQHERFTESITNV